MFPIVFVLTLSVLAQGCLSEKVNEDRTYWMNLGKEDLLAAESLYSKRINTQKAKNIILFIGDGMGLPTITATRIFKAQSEGSTQGGEESFLSFEKFPHVALSKIYSVDAQSPDSASTGSALYSGVKTNYYCSGFDNSCKRESLESHVNVSSRVTNIMIWSQEAGKSTGLVTTARVSHATPAGLVSWSAYRKWECDRSMPAEADDFGAEDITLQMATRPPGRTTSVILGGGRTSWGPKVDNVDYSDFDCWRGDNRDLVQAWMNKSDIPEFKNAKGEYVKSREELLGIDFDNTDYLLGLFSESHMGYVNAPGAAEKEPSLAEMTSSAIKVLSKNPEGFFLMVEGAKIDKAHHAGRATQALLEASAFDDAVKSALEMTEEEDTLIIVTADHGHGLHFGAYELRGSDVRGPSIYMKGDDGKTLPILSYSNGPGFDSHYEVNSAGVLSRKEMKDLDFKDPEYLALSSVQAREVTHSGSDVTIYARGPWAHFFHSVHEQSYVAHVMSYSACIGPHKDTCGASGSSRRGLETSPLTLLTLTTFFYLWTK